MSISFCFRAIAILSFASFILFVHGSPLQSSLASYQYHEHPGLVAAFLTKRLDQAASEFVTQFGNPASILDVLLIIGGDIVQKAIAQLSGGFITPVSFSFGWVSYSFTSLLSAFGDGVFLPPPDITAKVITIGGGGPKINESWIIARLIRDLELEAENNYRKEPWRLKTSLMVSVYDTLPDVENDSDKQVEKDENLPPKHLRRDWVWYSYFLVCLIQLIIATIPLYTSPSDDRNWSIVLITSSGILLALWTGSQWQFRKEKFACRRDSRNDYLLTRGNGHKHVFLIRHRKALNCRWPRGNEEKYLGVSLTLEDLANTGTKPAGWGSRVIAVLNAILWVFYLIIVGGQLTDTWYIFAVGAVGMSHNIMTASVKRHPDSHGFHMRPIGRNRAEVFGQGQGPNAPRRPKVIKVLMDLENAHPGAGIALLSEYFPGGLREGAGTGINPEMSEKEEWDELKKSLRDRKKAPEQKLGQNSAEYDPTDINADAVVSSPAPDFAHNLLK